jgi:hypothetical protein
MVLRIPRLFALAFALAVAFSPVAQSAAVAPPASHARAVHHGVRKARREAPAALADQRRAQESLPAISRNPEDCIKTMCTCLAGGGC